MSIFVHTGGVAASGPSVTFLHGAGMDHTVWRFQTRWLAHRGWRVLAPDLPAHAASDGEPFSSVEEGADWLAGFLSHRHAAGVVVGHSLGGLMAVETAARRPDLVHRLVLVGTGVRMPVHPDLMAAAHTDLPRAARFIGGWSMPPAHAGGHPEPGTWEQGGVVRLVEGSRPGVLSADLAAGAAYDATSHLPDIQAQALVVSGESDRMVARWAARALAEGVREATEVTMAGAGHQPMLQQPRTFNRFLAEFLRGDGKGSNR